MLRFPEGMRDRIAEAAKAAGRSMNAEIVARLKATFDETIVTTVEARAHPISDARFEFNADEIAQKVVEKLEGRKNASSNKVILSGDGRYAPLPSSLDYYYSVIQRMNMPVSSIPPRGNAPYGPKKSRNAKKPLPKS